MYSTTVQKISHLGLQVCSLTLNSRSNSYEILAKRVHQKHMVLMCVHVYANAILLFFLLYL